MFQVSENSQFSNFGNYEHFALLLFQIIKMNGHSVVFGQLVQKLEQIHVTPNSSTLQDNQNE